jgi:hypothetical protein
MMSISDYLSGIVILLCTCLGGFHFSCFAVHVTGLIFPGFMFDYSNARAIRNIMKRDIGAKTLECPGCRGPFLFTRGLGWVFESTIIARTGK